MRVTSTRGAARPTARRALPAALIAVTAACWSSPEPKEPALPSPRPSPAPARRAVAAAKSKPPLNGCYRSSPDGWPDCADLVELLVANGHACLARQPWSCTAPAVAAPPPCPPPGCGPIQARITTLQEQQSWLLIRIAAGSNQGIAMDWAATLVDASGQPVPDTTIWLLSVGPRRTDAVLSGLPGHELQSRGLVYVRFQP